MPVGISRAAGVEGSPAEVRSTNPRQPAGAHFARTGEQHPSGSAGDNGRLRQAAFEAMASAQVVLDPHDRLVHATELGRRMFALATADLGRPIKDLKLCFSPVELEGHLAELRQQRRPIEIRRVGWSDGDHERVLDVRIVPLPLDGGLMGTSISYRDVSELCLLEHQLAATRDELAHAYHQLDSVIEQFEIRLEEQRTMIELLEFANQQLALACEQVERTNAELQSAEQERAMLNAELDRRRPTKRNRHTHTHTHTHS